MQSQQRGRKRGGEEGAGSAGSSGRSAGATAKSSSSSGAGSSAGGGFKKGELVAWKYRAAMIVGHVHSINEKEGTVTINPEKKNAKSMVTRHFDKVMHASQMNSDDVKEAERRGGHLARAEMKSKGTPIGPREGSKFAPPSVSRPQGTGPPSKKRARTSSGSRSTKKSRA